MGQSTFSARILRQADVPEFLFALNTYLEQHCRDAGLSQRASVVVEELVVNAFWHGAAAGAGGVGVALAVSGMGLQGSVWHDGAPFDPSAAPAQPPGGAFGAGDDPALGCGLRIVQAFTTSLAYCRSGETNRVRFGVAPA